MVDIWSLTEMKLASWYYISFVFSFKHKLKILDVINEKVKKKNTGETKLQEKHCEAKNKTRK